MISATIEAGNEPTVACESCGASLHVGQEIRSFRCPYCDSPSVVVRPPTPDAPHPQFVVPFAVQQKPATERVKKWLGKRGPFAPFGIKSASVQSVRGVYLPAYLYSASAQVTYEAEIGEKYKNGNTTSTEWRPLQGQLATYVADILVSASAQLPNDDLEAIEPYDWGDLRRYMPQLLLGWMAQDPSLDQDTCFGLGREEAVQLIGGKLKHFLPGDSRRRVKHDAVLADETLELTWVPVWTFAAKYSANAPPLRIFVNGQTGKTHGSVPLSIVKVAMAVGLGIAALVVLLGLLLR